MLAKVKYFESEAPKPDITGPLSTNAEITAAYIERNKHRLDFMLLSEAEAIDTYPSIDFGALSIAEDYVIVASLFSDEDVSLLKFDISDAYATQSYVDNIDDTFTITVTSEDGSIVITARVVMYDLGTVTADAYLYEAISITETNTANEVNQLCRIYQPATAVDPNNELNIIDVGIIRMPYSYTTTQFNAGVPETIDVDSLSLTANADISVEYIAFDTTADNLPNDPDGETLIDTVSDAMTLIDLNSREFTADEEQLLDQAYVYIVLTNNTTLSAVYYKLVKNAAYDVKTPEETLKTELSDKYGHIMLNDIFVRSEDITNTQLQSVYRQTLASEQITYLQGQSIQYFDISASYTELIDQTITDQLNDNSQLASYNTLYDDAATYGFTYADILEMRKPFAQLFYDILILLNNDTDEYLYPASVQYMNCIINDSVCDINAPYYSSLTKVLTGIDVKTAMLNEIASSTWLLQNMNTRQFEWMRTRIVYLIDQIELGQLAYDMPLKSMKLINTMLSDLQIVKNELSAMPSYAESAIYSLFNELELLVASENVIQPISW